MAFSPLTTTSGCTSYCNVGLGWKSSRLFVQLGFLSNGSNGVSAKPAKLNAIKVFRACSTSSSSDPLLVKVARREKLSRLPAWMMRQAGRYMAVYKKLAEKHPSFRERSGTTDLIVEISLQPWKLFIQME